MDQAELNALEAKLHDSNANTRIATSEQLAKSVSSMTGNEKLPLFVTALGDVDAKVRYYAAAGLASIASFTLPKSAPLQPGVTDLASYQPLQAALAAILDDSNEYTRKNALATYALVYPVGTDLQDKLADRYDAERGHSLFQQAIITALTIDGTPSTKTVALLTRLVSDPQTSWKVAQAVSAAGVPLPNLLPQFVEQLSQVNSASKRADLARVIAKYGTQAKPFLGRIDAVKGGETDAAAKQAIQDAMQAISDSQ